MSEPAGRSAGWSIGRRSFLGGLGLSGGLLLAGGPTALSSFFGRTRYAELDAQECLHRLDASFTPSQRAQTVRPWDHPSRQVTNTVTIFKAPHIGTLFDADQRALVARLYETMVSDQGRAWLENTITLEGKLEGSVLGIYSDRGPGELARDSARTQILITGGHLMLRQGGREASGYAFGGPIAYGQQIGNGTFRVEGNAFAAHGDAANRLYVALDPRQRAKSLEASPPHELMVQPQGRRGRFPGLRFAALSGAAHDAAETLVHTVLASYPESDRRDALASLEPHGGLDALHVVYYEDRGFWADGRRFSELSPAERAQREDPYWQVWRIEGPSAVIHFKGYPHVHAYLNFVRDPAHQNVGEVLTRAPSAIDSAGVRELMIDALRSETGEALAWYADEAPARICAGDVTTGLVHALDPYANRIVIATVRGAAMSAALRAGVEALAAPVDPDQDLRVATIDYLAGQPDEFGKPERVDPWPRSLREALFAYLKDRELRPVARG